MIMATFTRASVAHKQDGSQVASGVPRYETGLSGQAVMVEEGTVNLLANTNGRPNSMGGGGTTPPTVVLVTDASNPFGVEAWKITFPGSLTPGYSGCRAISTNWPCTLGITYAQTVWVKAASMDGIALYHTGAAGMAYMAPTGRAIGAWVEYMTVAAPTLTGNDYLTVFASSAAAASKIIYVAAAQVEQKSYATSFTPGTRAAETLSFPTAGLILPTEGCIEIDFQLVRLAANYQPIFSTQIASGNRLLIMGNSGRIKVWDGDGTGELIMQADAILAAGRWYRVAYAWGPGGRTLALDGAIKTDPRGNPIGVAASAFLGWWDGYQPGVLIDRIRLFNRALTAAELLASYQGGL